MTELPFRLIRVSLWTLLLDQRQLELQKLASSEQQTREQMTYFKNELENRETNYNRRFVPSSDRGSRGRPDAAALRVVTENAAASKPKAKSNEMASAAPPRRKSARKKKAGSTTRLPKICKK